MKSFLKKYWWIILLLLIAPIVINYIIICPSPCKIVADQSAWLSFFGSFYGSAIMVGVTLYVLERQSQDNHQENLAIQEKNNSLHEYQIKIQWLDKLRDAVCKFYTSFYLNDLLVIADDIIFKRDYVNTKQLLKRLIDESNVASFNLFILFPKNLDNAEMSLLSKIHQLSDEHSALLEDLDWVISGVASHNGNFEMLKDNYISGTEEYRNEKINGYQTTSKRIWEIIKFYNYNICDNRKNIIDERMLSTELFSFANLQKAISELINYEEDKISKIIKQ
ncbi:hypothetical protein [Bacteroides intestinalis]|nr:hypothetical protein [Bacteroides intestinalis]